MGGGAVANLVNYLKFSENNAKLFFLGGLFLGGRRKEWVN